MALAQDLLAQAQVLATSEKLRPKQASLRRAVSSAYYGLFHFLIQEACDFVVSGTSAPRKALRIQLARGFEHGTMKEASASFVNGKNAWNSAVGSVPTTLKQIAATFVTLQEARHAADYNLARKFSRSEALADIKRVESAMVAWESVRGTPEAEAYLLALLIKTRR